MAKKYKKNADRVQQAIDVGKLALYGGIAYAGYKIYQEYKGKKSDWDEAKNRKPVVISVESQRETAKYVEDVFSAAGYIAQADFDVLNNLIIKHEEPFVQVDYTGPSGSIDIGWIVSLLDPKMASATKTTISGSQKLDEQTYKSLFETRKKIMAGTIKLIPAYTKEKPDPRTLYKTKSPIL